MKEGDRVLQPCKAQGVLSTLIGSGTNNLVEIGRVIMAGSAEHSLARDPGVEWDPLLT
jgi:hypothetical protein